MPLVLVVAILIVIVIIALQRKSSRSASSLGRSLNNTNPEIEDSPVSSLLAKYDLENKETDFFGPLKQGKLNGVTIAFRNYRQELTVLVGDFNPDEEQLTDVYLGRLEEGRTIESSHEQSLAKYLPEESKSLANKYWFLATGGENLQLKNPRVCKALEFFSDSVSEVGIFETNGVELSLDISTTTADSLDKDTRLAIQIFNALS